jgi:hypothetical protein
MDNDLFFFFVVAVIGLINTLTLRIYNTIDLSFCYQISIDHRPKEVGNIKRLG